MAGGVSDMYDRMVYEIFVYGWGYHPSLLILGLLSGAKQPSLLVSWFIIRHFLFDKQGLSSSLSSEAKSFYKLTNGGCGINYSSFQFRMQHRIAAFLEKIPASCNSRRGKHQRYMQIQH